MDEQSIYTQSMEKAIDWTSLVGVNVPVSGLELYHRVEEIDPTLHANGILRVHVQLKIFAVVNTDKEQQHVFNPNPSKIYTNDMNINLFFNLNSDIKREDILAIEHQVLIKDYLTRPEKIIVNGTLTIKVNYIIHPVLDGFVTHFSNGAPVGGITINLRKVDSEEVLSTTNTGSNGKYYFTNFPPGVYMVEALTDDSKPQQKISVVNTRDTVNFVLHK